MAKENRFWTEFNGRPTPEGVLSEEGKLSRILGNLTDKGGHGAPRPPQVGHCS
jgi:hypothetical protein